jgi:hypothetical protein
MRSATDLMSPFALSSRMMVRARYQARRRSQTPFVMRPSFMANKCDLSRCRRAADTCRPDTIELWPAGMDHLPQLAAFGIPGGSTDESASRLIWSASIRAKPTIVRLLLGSPTVFP